jgi:hypothetical protein
MWWKAATSSEEDMISRKIYLRELRAAAWSTKEEIY